MGTHEYIPVCEDLHPENKDNFEINAATLKAVKVAPNEWEKLNKAASWGVGNLKQAEKALKSKRRGYISDRKRAAAEFANSRNRHPAVCRNCPTCTDETGHKRKDG